MTELTGDTTHLKLRRGSDCYLETPRLRGHIVEIDIQDSRTRHIGAGSADSLQQALTAAGMDTELLCELETVVDKSLAVTRTADEPAARLVIPEPAADAGYALLHTDAAGVVQWIFPESQPADRVTRGAAPAVVFHIPRTVAVETKQKETRGAGGESDHRMIQVLTWNIGDLVGSTIQEIIARWENAKRPYGFVPVADGQFDIRPVDWNFISGGRALLLLHGTLSTARGSFGYMPPQDQARLLQLYENRVIAFNHPSLHQSPVENVQTLLRSIEPGISLDWDIITYSRGGLVGRELTERLAEYALDGRAINIRKAVFVASPNRGTALVDEDNMLDLINRYTNLLADLLDSSAISTFEAILTLVKSFSFGTIARLPGVASMFPGSAYLHRLNSSPAHPTQYYAIGANFTPATPALLASFARAGLDKFVDRVFGEDNDGVVPTLGSYQTDLASPGFPIPAEHRAVYAGATHVHHCDYFAHAIVNEQIYRWLAA